jgi:hypothetical protein
VYTFRVFAGHVRSAERLPGFGDAALRIELIQQAYFSK